MPHLSERHICCLSTTLTEITLAKNLQQRIVVAKLPKEIELNSVMKPISPSVLRATK